MKNKMIRIQCRISRKLLIDAGQKLHKSNQKNPSDSELRLMQSLTRRLARIKIFFRMTEMFEEAFSGFAAYDDQENNNDDNDDGQTAK